MERRVLTYLPPQPRFVQGPRRARTVAVVGLFDRTAFRRMNYAMIRLNSFRLTLLVLVAAASGASLVFQAHAAEENTLPSAISRLEALMNGPAPLALSDAELTKWRGVLTEWQLTSGGSATQPPASEELNKLEHQLVEQLAVLYRVSSYQKHRTQPGEYQRRVSIWKDQERIWNEARRSVDATARILGWLSQELGATYYAPQKVSKNAVVIPSAPMNSLPSAAPSLADVSPGKKSDKKQSRAEANAPSNAVRVPRKNAEPLIALPSLELSGDEAAAIAALGVEDRGAPKGDYTPSSEKLPRNSAAAPTAPKKDKSSISPPTKIDIALAPPQSKTRRRTTHQTFKPVAPKDVDLPRRSLAQASAMASEPIALQEDVAQPVAVDAPRSDVELPGTASNASQSDKSTAGVNMHELTAGVDGVNLALHMLVDVLDDSEEWNVDRLDAVLLELEDLARRRNVLSLYVAAVSTQSDEPIAALESVVRVKHRLVERIELAQANIKQDSESAILDEVALDELRRRADKLSD